MTTTIIIILLCLIIIAQGFVIFRLYKELTKFEDFYIDLSNRFRRAINTMKELKLSGAFESDDEVGWTFDIIYDTIDGLNKLINEDQTKINEQ